MPIEKTTEAKLEIPDPSGKIAIIYTVGGSSILICEGNKVVRVTANQLRHLHQAVPLILEDLKG